MRTEHGSSQSMVSMEGVACDGVDEVTGLAGVNTSKNGKEEPCRAFCKGSREMG